MLVQICCSVDSHYFLRKLKELYPQEKIIGFFYNPNIHPKEEFELRYIDVKRSCEELEIPLIKGNYDLESWLKKTKNLKNEPECGKRCLICFENRLNATLQLAKKIGEKTITSTLFMSPKKSHSQLTEALEKICKDSDINFVAPDFRKNNGTKFQFELAKKDKLYHQNYCGCIYAANSKEFKSEFFSPLNRQILPNSIEERIKIYSQISTTNLQNLQIKKEKILNYRLLWCLVKFEKNPIKSHIIFYSQINRKIKCKIEKIENKIFENSQIKILDFEKFQEISGFKFDNFDEFLKNPLSIDDEINFREKICFKYSLEPIVIVEKLNLGAYEISGDSKIYEDFKEIIK